MPARTGSAIWEGTLKGGKGSMKLGSGAYEGPFSFLSRFESGTGTNPEELIGAALAGCFSMALSANLEKAGHPATRVATTANVKLEMLPTGPTITTIELDNVSEVPGIEEFGVNVTDGAVLTIQVTGAFSLVFAGILPSSAVSFTLSTAFPR